MSSPLWNPWEILVNPSIYFSRKCSESSLNLFVVIMNPNSPGTTWCSNLEINRVKVWTHMCTSLLCGRETRSGGGRGEGGGVLSSLPDTMNSKSNAVFPGSPKLVPWIMDVIHTSITCLAEHVTSARKGTASMGQGPELSHSVIHALCYISSESFLELFFGGDQSHEPPFLSFFISPTILQPLGSSFSPQNMSNFPSESLHPCLALCWECFLV